MKKFWRNNRVFIIAEIGVNHNGDVSLAKKMIKAARESGCDAVKFQTFKAENLLSKKALLADYQKRNGARQARTQFDLIKKLELSPRDFELLRDYAAQQGVIFLSTPFDEESLDFLARLELPLFKISSGELTNLPFLRKVAGKQKWIILSTGMGNMREVKEAVGAIKAQGNSKIVLLHCVTEYPAPLEEINLRAIPALRQAFDLPVGFSDHTLGMDAAIAATAMGAVVIEKHFTLDRSMPGPDQKASMEPEDFKTFVAKIRKMEQALGDGVKRPTPSEKPYINLVRKSVVAQSDIPKGSHIAERDIAIKRPGYGIAPKDFNKVIGLKTKRNIKKDDVLMWTLLETREAR